MGWAPESPLDADVEVPRVVRLRERAVLDKVVVGTHRAHTDRSCRVVLSSGLRAYLGIEASATVVAWTEDNATLNVAPAALIPAAFGALEESGLPLWMPAAGLKELQS